MPKGKEIVCPYCCKKFLPDGVHFRLERPLAISAKANEEQEETGQYEEEQKPVLMGVPMQTPPARPRAAKKPDVADSKVKDELLFNYYMNYLNQSREDAENNSYVLPAVAFNAMSPDFEYNSRIFSEYGFVTEVNYKGQTLTNRLCPFCHNPVVSHAGTYETLIISIIGDTNVGKSVYLQVLYEMLSQDRNFEGNMLFMGTEEEKELYLSNLERLLNKKKVLEANDRVKVPPMPFLYKFRTADMEEKQSVIVIFCDIAGEDCRDKETLKKNGYHLKVSSGILYLVDPTRFLRVRNNIFFDREEAEAPIGHRHQYEILAAVSRYLMDSPDVEKSDIPAAIVVTKSDMLKSLNYFTSSQENMALLEDMRGGDIHPGYMSVRETGRMNGKVQEFLNAMEENRVCNVKDLFHLYNFFFTSALGMSPEFVSTEDDGGVPHVKRIRNINPYRVTEPFYWIMMKNGHIPCKYVETWKNKKNDEKKVEFYYYEGESQTSLENRKTVMRAEHGISEKKGLAMLLGPGWVMSGSGNA